MNFESYKQKTTFENIGPMIHKLWTITFVQTYIFKHSKVKRTPPYDKGGRLLDLMDTAIFDFIIGNADRHHYEVFEGQPDSMVLLLDNAKSFGNPELDDMSILAPIQQCCLLRKTTFER